MCDEKYARRDAEDSRDRKNVMPHDLLGQIWPATSVHSTREHPTLELTIGEIRSHDHSFHCRIGITRNSSARFGKCVT